MELTQFLSDAGLQVQKFGGQLISQFSTNGISVDLLIMTTGKTVHLTLSSQLQQLKFDLPTSAFIQNFSLIKQMFEKTLEQKAETSVEPSSVSTFHLSSAQLTEPENKALEFTIQSDTFPIIISIESTDQAFLFTRSKSCVQKDLFTLELSEPCSIYLYTNDAFSATLSINHQQTTDYIKIGPKLELKPDLGLVIYDLLQNNKFIINLIQNCEIPLVNFQQISDDGELLGNVLDLDSVQDYSIRSFDDEKLSTIQLISLFKSETVFSFSDNPEQELIMSIQVISECSVLAKSRSPFVRFSYSGKISEELKLPFGNSLFNLKIEKNFDVFQLIEIFDQQNDLIGSLNVLPNFGSSYAKCMLKPCGITEQLLVVRDSPLQLNYSILIKSSKRNLLHSLEYLQLQSQDLDIVQNTFISQIAKNIQESELALEKQQEFIEEDINKHIYGVPDKLFLGLVKEGAYQYAGFRIYNSSIMDLTFDIDVVLQSKQSPELGSENFVIIYDHQPVDSLQTEIAQGGFYDVQIRYGNETDQHLISSVCIQVSSEQSRFQVPVLAINQELNLHADSYMSDTVFMRNSGLAPARLFVKDQKALFVLNANSVQEIPILHDQDFRNDLFVRLIEGSNGFGVWGELVKELGFAGFDFGDLLKDKFLFLDDEY